MRLDNIIRNKNNYFKIFLSLVLSIYLAKILSSHLFLASTPKLRPNLAFYFTLQIRRQVDGVSNFLSSAITHLFFKQSGEVPKYFPSTSVRAFDNEEILIINNNQNKKIEYTFTFSNGKEVKINLPEWMDPPPAKLLENLPE